SRRRHTRFSRDWSSDVCSSDLVAKYDVTPEGIATAWITRHPAQMQVVLGTTTPQRVADSAAGSEVPLTRAEWYELFRAAGWIVRSEERRVGKEWRSRESAGRVS